MMGDYSQVWHSAAEAEIESPATVWCRPRRLLHGTAGLFTMVWLCRATTSTRKCQARICFLARGPFPISFQRVWLAWLSKPKSNQQCPYYFAPPSYSLVFIARQFKAPTSIQFLCSRL
jgi:hypothetical protein